MKPAERGAKEYFDVLKFAALAAAALSAAAPAQTPVSTAAAPSPALVSHSPWWETVTVTIAGDGQAQGCEYRTSLLPQAPKACDVVGAAGIGETGGAKSQLTRLTFERRFRPTATEIADERLPNGDTLLGSQVLALAIDSSGTVAGCKVVAATGEMTPDYGCKEAAAERFEASARSGAGATRTGYMSILVYGHAEHVV